MPDYDKQLAALRDAGTKQLQELSLDVAKLIAKLPERFKTGDLKPFNRAYADLEFKAGYQGDVVKTGLSGRIKVPLRRLKRAVQTGPRFDLGAYVDLHLGKGVSLHTTFDTKLFQHKKPEYRFGLNPKLDY